MIFKPCILMIRALILGCFGLGLEALRLTAGGFWGFRLKGFSSCRLGASGVWLIVRSQLESDLASVISLVIYKSSS